ncbi:hypothetical protein QYM36_004448, partial [Artemia franciscana]
MADVQPIELWVPKTVGRYFVAKAILSPYGCIEAPGPVFLGLIDIGDLKVFFKFPR